METLRALSKEIRTHSKYKKKGSKLDISNKFTLGGFDRQKTIMDNLKNSAIATPERKAVLLVVASSFVVFGVILRYGSLDLTASVYSANHFRTGLPHIFSQVALYLDPHVATQVLKVQSITYPE